MITFQKDVMLIINKSHEKYMNDISNLYQYNDILSELNLDEANKLIEYIKEYNKLIDSTCLIINKIKNIKSENSINNKIENELMMKIIPIMSVYRILLHEKYSNQINKFTFPFPLQSTINEQD